LNRLDSPDPDQMRANLRTPSLANITQAGGSQNILGSEMINQNPEDTHIVNYSRNKSRSPGIDKKQKIKVGVPDQFNNNFLPTKTSLNNLDVP